MKWIQHDICGTTSSILELPQPERVVVLDIFSGPKTKKVLDAMKERHIIPVYIPDGCTGYVQPMDTILNKLVKDKIADILEEMLEEVDLEETDDSIGRCRILITHAVAQA